MGSTSQTVRAEPTDELPISSASSPCRTASPVKETGHGRPVPSHPVGPGLPSPTQVLEGPEGQYLYVQVEDPVAVQIVQSLHQLLEVDLDLWQMLCSGRGPGPPP